MEEVEEEGVAPRTPGLWITAAVGPVRRARVLLIRLILLISPHLDLLCYRYHFIAPELFGAFLVFSFLSTVRVLIVRSVWLVALVYGVSANLIKKQLGVMKGSQNGKPLVFKLEGRASFVFILHNHQRIGLSSVSIAQPQGT